MKIIISLIFVSVMLFGCQTVNNNYTSSSSSGGKIYPEYRSESLPRTIKIEDFVEFRVEDSNFEYKTKEGKKLLLKTGSRLGALISWNHISIDLSRAPENHPELILNILKEKSDTYEYSQVKKVNGFKTSSGINVSMFEITNIIEEGEVVLEQTYFNLELDDSYVQFTATYRPNDNKVMLINRIKKILKTARSTTEYENVIASKIQLGEAKKDFDFNSYSKRIKFRKLGGSEYGLHNRFILDLNGLTNSTFNVIGENGGENKIMVYKSASTMNVLSLMVVEKKYPDIAQEITVADVVQSILKVGDENSEIRHHFKSNKDLDVHSVKIEVINSDNKKIYRVYYIFEVIEEFVIVETEIGQYANYQKTIMQIDQKIKNVYAK